MKHTPTLALAIVATLAVTPAIAQPTRSGNMRELAQRADTNGDRQLTFEEISAVAPQFTRERFDMLDQNGDGVLSREDRPGGEAMRPGQRPNLGGMLERLRAADGDGDGEVTRAEFEAKFPQAPERLFARLDRNGDGVVTPADAPQAGDRPGQQGSPAERFQRADTNGDGEVTREEFQAEAPNAPADIFDRFDQNGDGVLSAADMADRPIPAGPPAIKQRMDGADTDEDGKLSREEFKAAFPKMPEAKFDTTDANGDGYISREEIGK